MSAGRFLPALSVIPPTFGAYGRGTYGTGVFGRTGVRVTEVFDAGVPLEVGDRLTGGASFFPGDPTQDAIVEVYRAGTVVPLSSYPSSTINRRLSDEHQLNQSVPRIRRDLP